MKIKKFALLLCLALCACCLPANASSLGDIRVNARFLTDRMAFELNLNQSQYNDLFEINFDFLSGVDPYLTGMACADAAALDAYYRYLDERNDDLRWILSSSAYMNAHHFSPVNAEKSSSYLSQGYHFACVYGFTSSNEKSSKEAEASSAAPNTLSLHMCRGSARVP